MKTGRLAGVAAVLVLAAGICGIATAQKASIDEIGSVAAAETVTIGGTTNIAPGNLLLVTVAPIGLGPGRVAGASGTAVVQEGNATANTTFTVSETPPATPATPVGAAIAVRAAGCLVRRM